MGGIQLIGFATIKPKATCKWGKWRGGIGDHRRQEAQTEPWTRSHEQTVHLDTLGLHQIQLMNCPHQVVLQSLVLTHLQMMVCCLPGQKDQHDTEGGHPALVQLGLVDLPVLKQGCTFNLVLCHLWLFFKNIGIEQVSY